MSGNENEEKGLKSNDDDKNENSNELNKARKLNNNIKNPKNSPNLTEDCDFIIPNELTKTLTIALFTFILGTLFVILGLVKLITDWGILNGNIMLFLGCVAIIPGFYIGFQIYRAKCASFGFERKEILDSIPRI